jgi:FkbM family methyltransferase
VFEYFVGSYDSPAVTKLYSTFSGSLAFEVGANRGWLANVWAEQFEHVVACEPHPGSYGRLVEEAAPNVTPLNLAVSDHSGKLTLECHENTEAHGQLYSEPYDLIGRQPTIGQMTVECITLDDLTDTYGQPDFVKIDTEGHEVRIMDGGLETFVRGPQFLIEIHSKINGDAIYMILRKLGLDFTTLHHRSLRVPESNWYDHYWFSST